MLPYRVYLGRGVLGAHDALDVGSGGSDDGGGEDGHGSDGGNGGLDDAGLLRSASGQGHAFVQRSCWACGWLSVWLTLLRPPDT